MRVDIADLRHGMKLRHRDGREGWHRGHHPTNDGKILVSLSHPSGREACDNCLLEDLEPHESERKKP